MPPEFDPENVDTQGGKIDEWAQDLEGRLSDLSDSVVNTADLIEEIPDAGTPIGAAVETAVVAGIAADGTVADAAAAAVSGVGVVLKADPRAPVVIALAEDDVYADVRCDRQGVIDTATLLDGSKLTPEQAGSAATVTALTTTTQRMTGGTSTLQAEALYDTLTPVVDANGVPPEGEPDRNGFEKRWSVAAKARRAPNPAGQPIRVYGLWGQSNATPRAVLTGAARVPSPRVLAWSHVSGSWITDSYAPWLGNSFADEYLMRYAHGHRILLVPCGEGATGFWSTSLTGGDIPSGYHNAAGGTWDRTLSADPINLYDRAIGRMADALAYAKAHGEDPEIFGDTNAVYGGIIWSQGEQDVVHTPSSGTLQDAYAAKLDDMIGAARTALGSASLPFLVGGMTPKYVRDNASTAGQIQAALGDTPRRVQYTSFFDGPPSLEETGSGVHWGAEGYRKRGEIAARTALPQARNNVSTEMPFPPQNIKVSRSGNVATVTYDLPWTRVTSVTAQTCTDGTGSSWSTETLPSHLTYSFTKTVAAGTPLWVRMSATNEVGTSQVSEEVKA